MIGDHFVFPSIHNQEISVSVDSDGDIRIDGPGGYWVSRENVKKLARSLRQVLKNTKRKSDDLSEKTFLEPGEIKA